MNTLAVRIQFGPDESYPVAELAWHQRRCYLEFDPQWLARGIQISPFKLPLQAGLIEHQGRDFGPLPGVFDDSLPDGWGRLLMDRHFRRNGRRPFEVSILERLAWLGPRAMGALSYHPSSASEVHAQALKLARTALEVEQVLHGDVASVLPELLRAGGSPGGARPKLLIGLKGQQVVSGEDALRPGFEHWLVKIPTAHEGLDAGRVEYAYALMAHAAGVLMPPSQLLAAGRARACFAVRRFDRPTPEQRLHLHSLANLLHADFRLPSLDYSALLRTTQLLTRNQQDVLAAFRQMLFNIAAHNRDDHSKNFAFLMDNKGDWRLSPAFDLCPSDGPGGEHSMSVLGEGAAPTREHCLALASQFGIRRPVALALVDEVNRAVARWPEFAKLAGLAKSRTHQVRTLLRAL